MISEETWEKFKDGKVVFKCTTQYLWNKLMIELEKRGYKIAAAKCSYRSHNDGYGIDNGSGVLEWCNIGYYRSNYPYMEVVNVTDDSFSKPPVPPRPPQGLIDILCAIATCESIDKTYNIQLYLGELYDKRNEYLTKWTSEFEVHL